MEKKKNMEKKKIRVAELFAGVGGFRLGLEDGKDPAYSVVWSNQWEPATITQHASDIYKERFGDRGHVCEDIAKVRTSDIPDHDLLVGGFPCQDYSVARTLSQAAGLEGKKGVLWWQIHRILEEKGKKAPKYLMLENVDRLLKSPVSQRGRDFAIMLSSLSDLGYVVEWRVINAADYGMPQRRRRVYIMGYKNGTGMAKKIRKMTKGSWLIKGGVMSDAFPVHPVTDIKDFQIDDDLVTLSDSFNPGKKPTPFMDAGMVIDRHVYTVKTSPDYSGKKILLKDVLEEENMISEEFFVSEKDLGKWKELKDAKSEDRTSKNGFTYKYSEGSMAFPDHLDKPSRTIVTGEGGSTPSRFKHVVVTASGRYRRLTPVELERLNMFPEGHTEGATATKRAFFMGNALVVGIIKGLGRSLYSKIEES